MSSTPLPPTLSGSSTIDEQLRLRIAEELTGSFKGEIIGPDHAEYEQARQLWNAMVDRRPGLILRCTSTEDVVAAVNVAREHGLAPSVRCGGHNVAGKAMSDGGLTIDLSGLREVTVDPERKLVHVGGGCNERIHGVERPTISLTACDQPSPFIGDCAIDVSNSPLESNWKVAAQPLVQPFATCTHRESFDAAPQLSKSHDTQEDVILAHLVQPLDDSGVGARLCPFRNDVCVQ